MNSSMVHGGPDDHGLFIEGNVLLGHNRLSIIDLSENSHQPMQIEHVVLTYNGEIYNFREIKSELVNKGHKFSTTGDTEVIIRSYLEWGETCFERFNGMFSFGLLDKKTNQFYLVRDASGIKPLYYAVNGETLYFASEMKAFHLTELFSEDNKWKTLFLAFGHLPAPYTTLKGVKVFPKGNFLKWNLSDASFTINEYYNYSFKPVSISFNDAKYLIKEKLEASVERHLISDAPIGVFLSGGIDSSLLTLLAAKTLKNNLKTLSVYFEEEEFSEYKFQKIISGKLQGEHIAIKVTRENFYNEFDNIFSAMDQPTTDGINSYFISLAAHKSGLKAVLSGIGADELFGGYPSFKRMSWIKNSKFIPDAILSMTVNSGSDKIKKINYLRHKSTSGEYLFLRGFFPIHEIAQLTGNNEEAILNILNSVDQINNIELSGGNKATWLESNYYMHNQLLKDTDMMSMWYSLEVRIPFLDKELIQAVYSIPEEIKFNSIPKHLLIESFKNIISEEIFNRPKNGFVFPFRKWLQEINLMDEMGSGDEIMKKNIQKFRKGSLHWSRLWALYVSYYWKVNKFNAIAS